MRKTIVLCLTVLFVACATPPPPPPRVWQADLDAWVGQPVSALEKHPFFVTRPVVRTRASDGTEIWNYVNGGNIGTCDGVGSVRGSGVRRGIINYSSYSSFTKCMEKVAACNNLFYIRDGIVERYTPVGTGGMYCITSRELRPNYTGPMNLR